MPLILWFIKSYALVVSEKRVICIISCLNYMTYNVRSNEFIKHFLFFDLFLFDPIEGQKHRLYSALGLTRMHFQTNYEIYIFH